MYRAFVIVARGNYASSDNNQIAGIMAELFHIWIDAPDVYATRWALLGFQSICLQHLKQCCIENSERLLQTLVDKKDRSRKNANSREGAVSADTVSYTHLTLPTRRTV